MLTVTRIIKTSFILTRTVVLPNCNWSLLSSPPFYNQQLPGFLGHSFPFLLHIDP